MSTPRSLLPGLAAAVIAMMSTACVQARVERAAEAVEAQPAPILVHINGDGSILIDGEPVRRDDVEARFAAIAARSPAPEVHITGDGKAAYGDMAHVMAAAQRAGVAKLGVIGGT